MSVPKLSLTVCGRLGRYALIRLAFLIVPVLFTGMPSHSQSIGTWTFNNTLAGTAGTYNSAGSAVFSGAVPSNAFNGGTEFFGEGGWPSGGLDPNSYLEFSLSSNAGYSINISSIVLRIRRSNTGSPSGSGPTQWALRSSLDGFASDIANDVLTHNYANYTVSPGSSFLNRVGTIRFRLYGYSNVVNPGGSSRFVLDNITVNGLSALLPAVFGPADVSLQNNQPVLRYAILTTSRGDRYAVERSVDGSNFSTIEEITENENTDRKNYTYTDHTLPVGVTELYYRVRLENADGRRLYSAVMPLSLPAAVTCPFKLGINGNYLYLSAPARMQGKYQCRLYTSRGKILFRTNIILGNDASTITIPIHVSLARPDIYIITISNQSSYFSRKLFFQ